MEGFQNVAVTRQDNQLMIHWQGENLGEVKVYQSATPDFTESTGWLVGSTEQSSYTAAVQPQERSYFLLVAQNGARIRVAERVIPMDGLVNFRDLGGYLTNDGYRTKWGKLLRSAAHDAISEADGAFLQKIGLKTVVDYRSGFEEQEHPDIELAGVQYLHLRPFEDNNATNILDVSQFMTGGVEGAIKMLTETNRILATNRHCNSVYRELLLRLLDETQVPLVQHCTAGKDRVGVGSATILLALGVPRETILEDYLLSNQNQLSLDKLPADGAEVQPEQIAMFKALTQVHKEYLQAFFDEVDNTWGGTAGYLHNGLGFTGEQLNQLKKMYLEKM